MRDKGTFIIVTSSEERYMPWVGEIAQCVCVWHVPLVIAKFLRHEGLIWSLHTCHMGNDLLQ